MRMHSLFLKNIFMMEERYELRMPEHGQKN